MSTNATYAKVPLDELNLAGQCGLTVNLTAQIEKSFAKSRIRELYNSSKPMLKRGIDIIPHRNEYGVAIKLPKGYYFDTDVCQREGLPLTDFPGVRMVDTLSFKNKSFYTQGECADISPCCQKIIKLLDAMVSYGEWRSDSDCPKETCALVHGKTLKEYMHDAIITAQATGLSDVAFQRWPAIRAFFGVRVFSMGGDHSHPDTAQVIIYNLENYATCPYQWIEDGDIADHANFYHEIHLHHIDANDQLVKAIHAGSGWVGINGPQHTNITGDANAISVRIQNDIFLMTQQQVAYVYLMTAIVVITFDLSICCTYPLVPKELVGKVKRPKDPYQMLALMALIDIIRHVLTISWYITGYTNKCAHWGLAHLFFKLASIVAYMSICLYLLGTVQDPFKRRNLAKKSYRLLLIPALLTGLCWVTSWAPTTLDIYSSGYNIYQECMLQRVFLMFTNNPKKQRQWLDYASLYFEVSLT